MAETRTPRFRLVHWSSGTDSPQRVDFNETFLNIEALAAIDQQGPLADRPAPSKTGMYYFATDNGALYRSDGRAWAVVGASVFSQLVKPARTDSVAHTVQGLTGQSADLERTIDGSGTIFRRVRSNGDMIHGPLRVSGSAKYTGASDTAPADSAITVEGESSSMWGHTVKLSNSNSRGAYRVIRGTSTTYWVSPDGTVNTPRVNLTSAPSSNSDAVRLTDLNSAVNNARYAFDGPNLTGTLPVSRGGTGGTTQASARSGIGAAASATNIIAGVGLDGGGTLSANRTLSVRFYNAGGTAWGGAVGSVDYAARGDHSHALDNEKIIGTLPTSKGGTGGTTAATARSGIGAAASTTTMSAGEGLRGGGSLASNRTFEVQFPAKGTTYRGADAGSSEFVSRYDHTHSLDDVAVVGVLPPSKGGTGRTVATSGAYLRGNAAGDAFEGVTPTNLRNDIGAATSDHTHDINGDRITGTLSVSGGGTGATNASNARDSLAVPWQGLRINAGTGLTGGGNLTADRTVNVQFAGSGSANTVARSDHDHTASDIIGRLTDDHMPEAIELGGGVDLDTLDVTQDYTQTSSAEAKSGTNYPTGIAGKLRVVASSSKGMIWQKYTTYSTANPVDYVRTRYSGTWGPWHQVARISDIDALVNTYAAKSHSHSLSSSEITGTLPLNQGGTGATTAASARTALGVPPTSRAITAGIGLSGGGTLSSNRTINVVFSGNGSSNYAARSDHTHTRIDTDGGELYLHGTNGALFHFAGGKRVFTAGSGGDFTFNEAGVTVNTSGSITGASFPASGITGILPVNRGGTGRASWTTGNFLVGAGNDIDTVTPRRVRQDIGAALEPVIGRDPVTGAWTIRHFHCIGQPLPDGSYLVTFSMELQRGAGTGITVPGGTFGDEPAVRVVPPEFASVDSITSGVYAHAYVGIRQGMAYLSPETRGFKLRVFGSDYSISENFTVSFACTWKTKP